MTEQQNPKEPIDFSKLLRLSSKGQELKKLFKEARNPEESEKQESSKPAPA